MKIKYLLPVIVESDILLFASQGFHQQFQLEGNWFSQAGKTIWTEPFYQKNVWLRWSNQVDKITLTASQFAQCLALNKTPDSAEQSELCLHVFQLTVILIYFM